MTEFLQLALQNKDFWTTIITIGLFVGVILPFLKQNNKNIIEELQKIRHDFKKTTLDEEQTLDLLLNMMWFVSGKKIDFIKNIMFNNHIEGRREFITEKIRTGLQGFSDEYIAKFKTYNTPIGTLDLWLCDNFKDSDFEKMLDEIIDIIYRKDDGDTKHIINAKLQEISQIMKTLQVNLKNKLRNDLKNII